MYIRKLVLPDILYYACDKFTWLSPFSAMNTEKLRQPRDEASTNAQILTSCSAHDEGYCRLFVCVSVNTPVPAYDVCVTN